MTSRFHSYNSLPLCFSVSLLPLLFSCRGVVHQHLTSSTQAAAQVTEKKHHCQLDK